MTTVLYVTGTGRSGSTLLAGILGEIPGIFNAGEVRYLWQRGLVDRRLCGCGVPVPECELWGTVLQSAQSVPLDPAEMAATLRRAGRMRHLPGALVERTGRKMGTQGGGKLSAARLALGGLYQAIARVTGADVVVDSSKLPTYGHLLAQAPGVELRTVHLIRDPRAAAHSWSRRKALTDGASRLEMQRIGPIKSAGLWDVWNIASAGLLDLGQGSYLRIRYEDLVADLEGTLRAVLSLVGMREARLPIQGDRTVLLGSNHTVAGNPDRMRQGPVRVALDTRWHTMPRRDRTLVTTLTAPLLLRYGYPLQPALATRQQVIGDTHTRLGHPQVDESGVERFARRARLHLHWAGTEGIARLIEEDDLNPLTRARTAVEKSRWRRSHPLPPGLARPVFLVGLQRSGTNMLTRGLDRAPEFEVHNENDGEAFHRFVLRSDDTVRRIVERSRHRYVLFKPLCDSHRVDSLLDDLGAPAPGRAIWTVRDVDGRVRSALAKFGANNLMVLRDIAAGRAGAMWQAQRLSAPTLETIRGFDYESMTPETAGALFWWARNSLFFELGLERRRDVILVSYGDMLAQPAATMRALCAFLDLEYRSAFIAHISPHPRRSIAPLAIDPRVRQLCDQLQDRFDAILREQRQGWAA
jgi:hypothetical protein